MSSTRIPLGRAHRLASSISKEFWASGAHILSLSPVGSLRRYASDVGDVSLLATGEAPALPALIDAFAKLRSVRRVTRRTPHSVTVGTDSGDVTLHVADRASAGAALVCLTGSPAHVTKLTAMAAAQRLSLAPGRLLDATGAVVACETEQDFYERLSLPFIAPELRDSGDEIETAAEGRLPALLTDLHIRGDLHMHTSWSDGRDSVEDMVCAARELGYEYVAITDHSQRAAAARTLSPSDVDHQRAEIQRARQRQPSVQILHGLEVEILKDGTLDFDDGVLAGFDIILASLHDHGGQPAGELTKRYLAALDSPFVDVITHPANRSPGDSQGYEVDFDRIFEAARQTGTALEVDGAPGHLDMDGALARRAAAAGVTIVVDSDSHRADALGRQMRFGIGTARRGWLEPKHVLNTRGIDEIRAFIARQRARSRS